MQLTAWNTGKASQKLDKTRIGVLTNRRSRPNELIFLTRNKKDLFPNTQNQISPGNKKGAVFQTVLPITKGVTQSDHTA